jgi:hypothetical protein
MESLEAPEHTRPRYADKARFVFPPHEGFGEFTDATRPIVEYFYLIFPMRNVENILAYTNEQIAASNYPDGIKRELTKAELFKWFGIRLAMRRLF